MAGKPKHDPKERQAAQKWFSTRIALTEKEQAALGAVARERGYTIGGTMQLRVVQAVLSELQRAAVRDPADFGAFKQRLRARLKSGYVDKNNARLKTSFQTTVQKAYNAGRWAALMSDESLARRPYLILDAVMDAKTTPLCRRLDGTVRRTSDPFWKTHWPPLHFNCRTSPRGLTVREARRRGVSHVGNAPAADDGFGQAPDAGDEWAPERGDYDPAAYAEFERKVKRMRAAAAVARRVIRKR